MKVYVKFLSQETRETKTQKIDILLVYVVTRARKRAG